MSSSPPDTLREAIAAARPSASAVLSDGASRVPLRRCLDCMHLDAGLASFAGQSVLIAVDTQLEATLALIDLDGLARRLVLLPPDVKEAQLPAIIRDAQVDVIVCSAPERFAAFHLPVHAVDIENPVSHGPETSKVHTEWLLLTSGTTGDPKLAIHSLAGLTGAITRQPAPGSRPVWATFYDIRRYGGLQILLRALFGGASLILSRPGEPATDHLHRLAEAAVTHVSGTPTHWRRVLMTKAETGFDPAYIRLSGEIADQAVLDALAAAYPRAAIGHAYASTEAGVGFDVTDGREGFPATYLDAPRNGVELRIVDGCLQLRSSRRATSYAGRPDLPLADAEGWVDSGDMVEVRDGRCRFLGRRSGVINVGGLKVHPEEIEAVIVGHAAVRQAKVRPRKSPIIGSIVVADVVLRDSAADAEAVKRDIIGLCREALPVHKVPALVNVVAEIAMTAGGKVSRQNA